MKENQLAFAVGGVIGLALMVAIVLAIGPPNDLFEWAFLFFETAAIVVCCGIFTAFIRSFLD